MDSSYRSRKFIVTMFGMFLGSGVLMFGALYVPPVEYWGALPSFFILLAAGISAYNWANLRQAQNGASP
jgi:hypothetical protein